MDQLRRRRGDRDGARGAFDESWLGRPLRREMLDEFTPARRRSGAANAAEYHTVVTNSPLFDRPITLETGVAVQRSGCWALDVVVAAQSPRT